MRDVGVQDSAAPEPNLDVAGISGCKGCYPAEVCCTATYTKWIATVSGLLSVAHTTRFPTLRIFSRYAFNLFFLLYTILL